MKVKFVGFGGAFDTPVYKDSKGRLYFDENYGECGLNLYTGAWKDDCVEICVEPNRRVAEEVKCDKPYVKNPKTFEYSMLDRLKMDCNYFLSGGGCESNLWGRTVEDHISKMKKLWNSFNRDEKPEWLTLEQINEYEKEMLMKRGMKNVS